MGNITRDQHKFLSFAAEQIRKAQVDWGIPHSFISALSKNELVGHQGAVIPVKLREGNVFDLLS